MTLATLATLAAEEKAAFAASQDASYAARRTPSHTPSPNATAAAKAAYDKWQTLLAALNAAKEAAR